MTPSLAPHPRNYFRLACVFYFSLLEKQERESKEKTGGLEGHNAQRRLDSRLTRLCLPGHPLCLTPLSNPALPPRIWGSQYSNRVQYHISLRKKSGDIWNWAYPSFRYCLICALGFWVTLLPFPLPFCWNLVDLCLDSLSHVPYVFCR